MVHWREDFTNNIYSVYSQAGFEILGSTFLHEKIWSKMIFSHRISCLKFENRKIDFAPIISHPSKLKCIQPFSQWNLKYMYVYYMYVSSKIEFLGCASFVELYRIGNGFWKGKKASLRLESALGGAGGELRNTRQRLLWRRFRAAGHAFGKGEQVRSAVGANGGARVCWLVDSRVTQVYRKIGVTHIFPWIVIVMWFRQL